MNDMGGATAIFNQTFFSHGLRPRVPVEVQLVFPRRNQFVAFLGDRYHGVLADTDAHSHGGGGGGGAAPKRKTLLINWWKDRPREAMDEGHAEQCGHDPEYEPAHDGDALQVVVAPGREAPEHSGGGRLQTHRVTEATTSEVTVAYDAPFEDHLAHWIKQLPPPLPAAASSGSAAAGPDRWGAAGFSFVKIVYGSPSDMNDQESIADTDWVPAWGLWTQQ
jgi:hypothetical protein